MYCYVHGVTTDSLASVLLQLRGALLLLHPGHVLLSPAKKHELTSTPDHGALPICNRLRL
jgi:hypothetical protein